MNVGEKERRKIFTFSPFILIQIRNIMGKGKQVKVNVNARRKPKLSSNKGGFMVAKVSAVNKKQHTSNG